MFEIAAEGGQPVAGEIRDQLLEPFITATRVALGEMASNDVVLQALYQETRHHHWGDIAAVLELKSETEGFLILSFPARTAAALAGRILAEVTTERDENLFGDCVGELANVVAGQAKALLADTPYRFAFFTPKVVVGASSELRPRQDLDCL